jgi:hypothetical protein
MGSDKCVSVYLYKYAYATATDRTGDDWDVPPTSDVARRDCRVRPYRTQYELRGLRSPWTQLRVNTGIELRPTKY